MARRSSNNNQGCGTILLGLLCIGMVGSIVTALKTGLLNIVAGFGRSIPFLALALLVIAFLNIIFNITHKTPITYDQARKLAKYYAQSYIRKTYKFRKGALPVDPYFKSNMNATGMWYDIAEPLSTFPAYIASLLKGKQHEWVVLAIEKDGIVYNMWVNKGMNNQQVTFNCDLKDIVQKSLNIGGYSILRFHNHPNSDPTHYTTLVASEQDKISAASCAEYVSNSGLNWFDFVCARGDFLLFYSKISDTFEVNGSSTSDIVDRIGITPEMNLQLQREYHNHCGIRKILKSKIFIISVALCLIISFYYTGKGTVALPGVKFEPTQDYLISTLSSVPGIEEIEAVTLETDRNRILGSECSSIVFFTYNKVDQTSINNTGNTPILKGTDGGGCIEVFFDSSKAQRRMFKLKATSFLSGSSFQYGSAVIRTSSKLTSSEQVALQNSIIATFQKYPIAKGDNIAESVSTSSMPTSDIVDSNADNLSK